MMTLLPNLTFYEISKVSYRATSSGTKIDHKLRHLNFDPTLVVLAEDREFLW